jgi:hypothetical protein
MRGSMFVANPWARQPMRPIVSVRLAQTCPIDAAPGECPFEPEPLPDPTVTPPTPSSQPGTDSFPIVPVAVGAGALVLAALLF